MYNHFLAQQIVSFQIAASTEQHLLNINANAIGMASHSNAGANADSDNEEEDEQKRTLFCANLDERVTEELLYEVFLQAGPIDNVRIPKDNTGRQRTFGFVTYVHQCSAPYAVQLFEGLAFFRKTLTIRYQYKGKQPPAMGMQHLLPNDAHALSNSRRDCGNVGGYDNTSLRGTNYAPDYDRNGAANPFRQEIPEWTLNTAGFSSNNSGSDRQRTAKRDSSQSRSNNVPHQRREPYDYHRRTDSHSNDYHRRSQQQNHNHSNSNSSRRSEQRSGGRRR